MASERRERRVAEAPTEQGTSIAVAIVSYNTRQYFDDCLASVQADGATDVVVVDNGSTDGSIDLVRTHYPWVNLYVSETNRGYGAAANQAMAHCQAEYVLILNSDTRLRPGALHHLSRYLDQQPKCGVVGPRLINADGSTQRSCFPFPTPVNVLARETSLGRLLKRVPYVSSRNPNLWAHSHARVVPWILGAALAVRREAFADAGGFDESYFMYSEDADLGYRMQAAQWEVHYYPDAEIMHVGGGSASQYRAAMEIQLYASRRRLYRIYSSGIQLRLLQWITSYILLRNIVRDALRRHLRSQQAHKELLAAEVETWKRILAAQRKDESNRS